MKNRLKEAIANALKEGYNIGDHVAFNREAVRKYNPVIPFSSEYGTIRMIDGAGLKIETDDGYEILVYFNDIDNATQNRFDGQIR